MRKMRRPFQPAVRLPRTLERDCWLVVKDARGTTVSSEHLPLGTDLPQRLQTAADEYAAQGWSGRPVAGHWSFIVARGHEQLAIGIRASRPPDPSSRL